MQKRHLAQKRRKKHHLRHFIIIAVLLIIFIFLAETTVYFNSLRTANSYHGKEVPAHSPTGTSSSSSLAESRTTLSSAVSQEPDPPVAEASSQESSLPPESSSEIEMPPAGSAPNPVQFPYQELYPHLYVPQVEKQPLPEGGNAVYLTFDDGPSEQTRKVLDILKEHDIKATFFLVGRSDENSKDIIREIADQGHTIGVHTYSHVYKSIYASPEAFLDDFAKIRDLIVEVTGEEPTIFRFAGGSVNSYNKTVAKAIIDEMTRRGYTYYDWNVSAGDAEAGATPESIYWNTINGVKTKKPSIVLLHDAPNKSDTVKQLPAIIEQLKKDGYRFEKLDPSVPPIVFPIPKE